MKNITIGGREVGEGQPVFIIAEVSANHRGKIETALSAIDAAAEAGADAVKFQHLTGTTIAADIPIDTLWNGKPVGTLSAFYAKSELPYEWTPQLVARAKERNIIFLSTPFDHEAVEVLDEAGVPAFKVASYELTDDILLRYIAKKGKPIIISTGMAYLDEVKHAVEVIRQAGNEQIAEQIAVLHCVSLYPPQPEDLNLKAIETMRRELALPIGYSDHSAPSSNAATLGAVALGACIIERHITDSQEGGSNDDKNSMTVAQFKAMVAEVRFLSSALSGSGVKAPVVAPDRATDEMSERGTRRSLYAACEIKAGETLTEDMVLTLRPMRGIEPKDLQTIVGKKASRAIPARSPITKEDIAV
ncbi:MAG: N-acetylneuraminate synthase family protein [Patescibacteria group bacterium]